MEENKTPCTEECCNEEQKIDGCQEDNVEETEASDKCSAKEKKKLKKAEEEIAKLTEAIAQEQDKYMRLYAEYDNFRKRSAKEKEGVYADAYSDCIAGILPIDAAQRKDLLEKAKNTELPANI